MDHTVGHPLEEIATWKGPGGGRWVPAQLGMFLTSHRKELKTQIQGIWRMFIKTWNSVTKEGLRIAEVKSKGRTEPRRSCFGPLKS